MAISFYTGIPRSGKSIKAVSTIFYYFVKKKKSLLTRFLDWLFKRKDREYDYCYNNINQFNFDISDKIFQYKHEEIFLKLEELHALYLAGKNDYELIEHSKQLCIYNSLFVIDECQNYFKSKENPTLTWWLTYHGHLHQDIILITQDLKLVNDEYKRVAEFFYKAVPQRLRFSKNTFKYREYSTHTMYEKNYIKTISLTPSQEMYKAYVSGSEVHTTPIIYKFLIMFIVLITFVFIAYANFESDLNDEPAMTTASTQNTKPIQQTETTHVTEIKEDTLDYTNLQLYKFQCYNEKYCYYNDIELPYMILKPFINDLEDDRKYITLNRNRLVIYLLEDKNKFNFLKGVKNEENKVNDFTMSNSK